MPAKANQPDDFTDSATAWFAMLERARLTDDYALAAKAEEELERLGVRVRFMPVGPAPRPRRRKPKEPRDDP